MEITPTEPAIQEVENMEVSDNFGELGAYETPEIPHESTMETTPPQPQAVPEVDPPPPVTFTLTMRTSQKTTRQLISSDGYTHFHKASNVTETWICSKANNKIRCMGKVRKTDGRYHWWAPHTCNLADPQALTTAFYKRDMLDYADSHMFGNNMKAATEEFVKRFPASERQKMKNLPKIRNVAEQMNRLQRKRRPKNPSKDNINFELATDFLNEQGV